MRGFCKVYRSPQRQGQFGSDPEPKHVGPRPTTFGETVSNWLKVLGIFLLVRLVMFALQTPLVSIPFVDPLVLDVLQWMMYRLPQITPKF